MAASLHHPNVVAVYDWGEDETPVHGPRAARGRQPPGLLDRGDRLSPAQAAAVGRQVAAALDYAHARGLVHRDVKPANLLFDEHGTVRVADFGLARALAEASWTEPAGAVLGTARYAAPEQVRGHRRRPLRLLLPGPRAGRGGDRRRSRSPPRPPSPRLLSRVERHLEVPPELGPLAPGPGAGRPGDPDEPLPRRRGPSPPPWPKPPPCCRRPSPSRSRARGWSTPIRHPTEIRHASPSDPTTFAAPRPLGPLPSAAADGSGPRRSGDPGLDAPPPRRGRRPGRRAAAAAAADRADRGLSCCWWRRARRPSPSGGPPGPGCGCPTSWAPGRRRRKRPPSGPASASAPARSRPTIRPARSSARTRRPARSSGPTGR